MASAIGKKARKQFFGNSGGPRSKVHRATHAVSAYGKGKKRR